VPIAVRLEGSIRTHTPADPPSLRRIQIALNRDGHLSSAGLPLCPRQSIKSVSTARALAVCGDALIGAGSFRASSTLPDQSSRLLRGQILLFNARAGEPAILAHFAQSAPAPLTALAVFSIRRAPGTFATQISTRLPAALTRDSRLRQILLTLQRTYTYRGSRRGYISAACATPPGVPIASFPLARISLGFDDGRTLFSTLTRTCRVRG
jgi:hypothetical protein